MKEGLSEKVKIPVFRTTRSPGWGNRTLFDPHDVGNAASATGRRGAGCPYLNSQKKTDANTKKAGRGLKFLLPPFRWQFASERQGRQKPAEMRDACGKTDGQDPACRRNRQRRLDRSSAASERLRSECRSLPAKFCNHSESEGAFWTALFVRSGCLIS